MRSRPNPGAKAVDLLAAVIEGFDYKVDDDDFLLYELGRLIEEDRASFDDEEFRRIIDEGIREYIEERLDARAGLAERFRMAVHGMDSQTAAIALRVIQALEDAESELRNVGAIVRNYTAYLFERLQAIDDTAAEADARLQIEEWRHGSLPREQLVPRLVALGRAAVAPAADLLFDVPDDPLTAETAIDVLGQIRSPVSARVLAHAISEPLLEEDLEEKAFRALRDLWPLPRHYMLYTLRSHTHEDLPFRWFQLFVESDDILAVDQILEEVRMHSQSAAFQEDLAALVELLLKSRDPEIKEKALDLLNDSETPKPIAAMLTTFLRTYRDPAPLDPGTSPWARRARIVEINSRYRKAARLFDSGKTAEASRALDDILATEPNDPLSWMLRKII